MTMQDARPGTADNMALPADLLPALDRLDASLQGFHGPSEEMFLNVGEHLQIASRAAGEITDIAVTINDAMNSRELRTLVDRLQDAVSRVQVCHAGLDDGRTEIESIAADVRDISKVFSGMLRVMRRVGIIATNARVLSAQIRDQSVDFNVFNTQIGELGRNGENALQEILSQLEELQSGASSIHNLHVSFVQEHSKDLERVASRLSHGIGLVVQLQESLARIAAELPIASRELRSRISTVVSGLQLNDSVRQRVEHVQEGLRVIARVLRQEKGIFDQPLTAIQEKAFAFSVASLSLSHMGDIRQTYQNGVSGIEVALAQIPSEVERLASLCHRIQDGGDTHGEDRLQIIDQDLSRATVIIESYARSSGRKNEMLSAVIATAQQVGESISTVHMVDSEMHLLGLNASIKCGNLGVAGNALNVVAGQIQAAARETQESTATAQETLTRLSSHAEKLADSRNRAGEQTVGQLSQDLNETQTGIRQHNDQLSNGIRKITSNTGTVEKAIKAAVGDLGRHRQLDKLMHEAIEDIQILVRETDPGLSASELENVRSSFLSFLEKHYTMDAERDIHHRREIPSPAEIRDAMSETRDGQEQDHSDGLNDILF